MSADSRPIAIEPSSNDDGLSLRIDQTLPTGFRLNVDLNVPLRGITALFGPSGSGKTTLLGTIAGLRRDLEDAHVSLAGDVWQDSTTFMPPWRRPIACVFQDARLFPDRSVTANLAYATKRAIAGGLDREAVIDWLGLATLIHRMPATLSAGEQQRVAIARALLRNPRLLLLDEPLSNLDSEAAIGCIKALIRIEKETHLPMLYVSHTLEEIHALADRVLILKDGEITANGPLLELASSLDSGLVGSDAAAAIVDVTPKEGPAEDGLRSVAIDGQTIWVSADSFDSSVQRLRIPARDVSICLERPQATSILNVLEVSIAEMKDLSEAHCLLRLRLQSQYLLARITQRSRRDLDLRVGNVLFAQVKSTALLGDPGPR